MQLRNLGKSLTRRWYFVLLGLALASILCTVMYQRIPLNYKAQGSIVLLPPAVNVVNGNPYLYLGGMGQALDVLTRKLASDDVKTPISDRFPDVDYVAETDRTTSGSILLVTVQGRDQAEAMGALGAILNQVPSTLESMQVALSVPATARITTMKLLVDSKPTVDSKTRTQVVMAAAAGGLTLTLLLTGLLDGLLLGRKARSRNGLSRRNHGEHRGAATSGELAVVERGAALAGAISAASDEAAAHSENVGQGTTVGQPEEAPTSTEMGQSAIQGMSRHPASASERGSVDDEASLRG